MAISPCAAGENFKTQEMLIRIDNEVRVPVTNCGPGMSAEELPKLFDRWRPDEAILSNTSIARNPWQRCGRLPKVVGIHPHKFHTSTVRMLLDSELRRRLPCERWH